MRNLFFGLALSLAASLTAQASQYETVRADLNVVVSNSHLDLRQALLLNGDLQIRSVAVRFETNQTIALSLVSNGRTLTYSQLTKEFGYTQMSHSTNAWNLGAQSFQLGVSGTAKVLSVEVVLNRPAPPLDPGAPSDVIVTMETHPNESVQGRSTWTYFRNPNYAQYNGLRIRSVEVVAAPLYLNSPAELSVQMASHQASWIIDRHNRYTLSWITPEYFDSNMPLTLGLKDIHVSSIKLTLTRP